MCETLGDSHTAVHLILKTVLKEWYYPTFPEKDNRTLAGD